MDPGRPNGKLACFLSGRSVPASYWALASRLQASVQMTARRHVAWMRSGGEASSFRASLTCRGMLPMTLQTRGRYAGSFTALGSTANRVEFRPSLRARLVENRREGCLLRGGQQIRLFVQHPVEQGTVRTSIYGMTCSYGNAKRRQHCFHSSLASTALGMMHHRVRVDVVTCADTTTSEHSGFPITLASNVSPRSSDGLGCQRCPCFRHTIVQ